MIWNSQTNKYDLSDIPAVTASDIGAIPVPTTAEVGQTIVVKAVDENGKPTEWEPVTLPKQVQSDWNQNNISAVDYVKNRPFYSETRNVTVENAEEVKLNNFPVFAVGDTVTVNVDGVEHSLVAYYDDVYATIGDTTNSIDSGEGQLGWQIYVGNIAVWFYAKEAHTVSYSVEEVVKIDEKYLPPISKQVVYDLSNAVFKEEGEKTYYFVDPTTLTDILKSINTGSPMPYIGLKVIGQSSQPTFLVNVCINFGWGISMDTEAVTVLGMTSTILVHVYIFDTFEHAKAYYER